MERIKKNCLIAELANALTAFQEAEKASNEDMMEVMGECLQMWKRKQLMEKIKKEK